MQLENIETFNYSEFEEAIECGMEAVSTEGWGMRNIHTLISETMKVNGTVDVKGEVIPLEWTTGFVFGVIQEYVVNRLIEKYGDQIRDYLNRH